jgi:hypothetical protein
VRVRRAYRPIPRSAPPSERPSTPMTMRGAP